MKISVLTSTFCRANLLDKLYTSLIINSNTCDCEIEWLIMDDGSTDNTKTIVENYIRENIIQVKYFYHENSGKMKSINDLVKEATGDWLIECDSDDYFTVTAFKSIKDAINNCATENTYALAFLKYDHNGENMGNEFPEDNYESTMFDLYFRKGITGEKALVYHTKIRKQYAYELENEEKFITEARLHHKMDLDYHVRCFNQKIMICQYREDGYTQNIFNIFMENPYGYYAYFLEILQHDMKKITFSKRMYIYKHYILFSVLTKKRMCVKNVKGLFNKLMIALLYIPGRIATKIKIRQTKKKTKEEEESFFDNLA